jgi:pimeloyl-ACP methyl ester carboxylesterase
MGGMISILQTAQHRETVSGLVLVDPAVPGARRRLDRRVAGNFVVYALPGVGERYLAGQRRRRGTRATVTEMLELCGVDPASVPDSLLDRSAALIDQRQDVSGMDRAFLTAARSLLLLLADPRLMRRSMRAIDAPVLLLHGDRDRLVDVSAARDAARRHPDWRYVELAGVGHVPQLQVPQRFADELLTWLAEHPEVAKPAG